MTQVRVRLTFPEELVRQPLLAHLVRRLDVEPNIRRAAVEEDGGWMLCELRGEASVIESAITWLRDQGVGVDLLGDVLEG